MRQAKTGSVLLWRARGRVRGHSREVRCTVEQLAECFFELRLLSGDELLFTESFEDTGKLLSRSEQLRAEVQATA